MWVLSNLSWFGQCPDEIPAIQQKHFILRLDMRKWGMRGRKEGQERKGIHSDRDSEIICVLK